MKSLLTTLLFVFTGYLVLGQCDPRITGFSVAKSPIDINEITNFTVSFGVGNNIGCNGSNTLLGAAGSIRIDVSFNPNTHPVDAIVSGDLAPYFTWTYDAGSYTLSGVNLTAVPLGASKDLVIPVKGFTSTQALPGTTNYSNVNWTSETDVPISNTSTGNDTQPPISLSVTNNPLPVRLIEFDAKKEGEVVNLSWKTTEESNSDRFDVQHSTNAKNWNSIGTVKAKGESKVMEKYSFTHAEPVEGENLYRLKMVDQDGSFAYSRIVSVTFGEGAGAQIYPNPASDYLVIKSAEWKSVSKLKIISLNGQNVFEAMGKTLTNQIDIRKMDPGVYLLEITRVNGQKDLKKFVVVH